MMAARPRACTPARAQQPVHAVQDAEQDVVTLEVCGPEYCYGCMRAFQAAGEAGPGIGDGASMAGFASRCPQCRRLFCYDCDAFVHMTLHNCPGCENGEHRQQAEDLPDANGMDVD